MLERTLRQLLSCLSLALCAGVVQAKEAEPASADPAIEARVMAVAVELRCLVCQNQTIADSHADLAVDLRREIREMLTSGKTEAEIHDYMTQRYGDFVLYKPPFKATTAVLWIGPGVLLVLALGMLVMVLRKRQRLSDDAFDPEPEVDPNSANGT